MITSKSMNHVSPGNAASSVESQTSASGVVGKGQGLPQPATSVVNVSTQRQSSPQQIEHEYSQDEDRMQCEHCGFWYHA